MKQLENEMNSEEDQETFRSNSLKKQREILFKKSVSSFDLPQDSGRKEALSSDALKKYLQHIGYYKGKKRKRCLAMELEQILFPNS